jgi:pimeloyl-ACP methyl ester carboxylesterase
VEATMPMAVKTTLDLAFGPQAEPRIKELTAQRMNEIRYPVLYGDFMACNAFDENSLLGRAGKSPTLIICGSEDKMTPPPYSQMMHQRLKKSVLRIVEGAGHMVMLEQPQAVANILQLFLNSISYQPGDGTQ